MIAKKSTCMAHHIYPERVYISFCLYWFSETNCSIDCTKYKIIKRQPVVFLFLVLLLLEIWIKWKCFLFTYCLFVSFRILSQCSSSVYKRLLYNQKHTVSIQLFNRSISTTQISVKIFQNPKVFQKLKSEIIWSRCGI